MAGELIAFSDMFHVAKPACSSPTSEKQQESFNFFSKGSRTSEKGAIIDIIVARKRFKD